MKRIAILQSSYIPWKGYFDIIRHVDEFVLYDVVQFTRNDWRNRNRIKTPQGLHWLTIPVKVERREQSIRDTRVADQAWRRRHWKTLRHNYARTPCFNEYAADLEKLYLQHDEEWLSDINRQFLTYLANQLGIQTPFRWAAEFSLRPGRTDRLGSICEACGATDYLTGPAARNYLDISRFDRAGIRVRWMNYNGYPEYDQPHPPFEHAVTVLDLLFSKGRRSPQFLLSNPVKNE